MIRLRNLVLVLLGAAAVYALAPRERKVRFVGKLREFVRALGISLVIYWLLMIGRTWIAGR